MEAISPCASSPPKQAPTVALLTNFIPPYRIPLFEALGQHLGKLSIFLSIPMEPNRAWPVSWNHLNVTLQRNLVLRQRLRHPLGFSEAGFIHLPYDTLWLLWKHEPQVIISAEFGIRTLLAALYRRFNPRTRLIIWAMLSEHTEKGRGRLRDALRHWLTKQADAFLVSGESGARYLQRFGVSDTRMYLVPGTTTLEPFIAAGGEKSETSAIRLVYVGRLVPLKGLEGFLSELSKWAAKHPDREIEFWIAGEGPLQGTLMALPHPSNLKHRFLGALTYDDVPSAYAQADIFAFPTLADEWGLVVNEAMAAGLPILGSLFSQAVEDLVTDGVNGWTFRADDAEAIQMALDRALLTPKEHLLAMGHAARERSLAITPESVATTMLSAIHDVLGDKFPIR